MNGDGFTHLQTLIANATHNGVTKCHVCGFVIASLDDADEDKGHLVHEWCIDVDTLLDDADGIVWRVSAV